MNSKPVLADIIVSTQARLAERKIRQEFPSQTLATIGLRKPLDFVQAILSSDTAVIAEVKASSPSQGVIKQNMDPVQTAKAYQRAGAAAISVLTEPEYFGGSLENLARIRKELPTMPLLQKDFIVDEFQIQEALHYGADAILLIMAVLGEARAQVLQEVATSLGLTSLVEVHDANEMKAALRMNARLIGVNNRNLQTMQVSLENSRLLAPLIPADAVVISESGIENRVQILELQQLGYKGFLVGTSLMRSQNPADTLRGFMANPFGVV
jgi:indole-3-glycerol phosphate synthase